MCIPLIKLYSLCLKPFPKSCSNILAILEATVPFLKTIIASLLANIFSTVILLSVLLLSIKLNPNEFALLEKINPAKNVDKNIFLP